MGLTFGELTDTPVGPVSFVAGDGGLQRVSFQPLQALKAEQGLFEEKPSLEGLKTIGILLAELNEYLFGIRKTFSVKVDWNVLEGFQRQVLELTADIPYGELNTYGEMAEKLGKPGAARAVGGALGRNPMPIVIPCHRVVGSGMKLVGYTGGLDNKAFMLGLEGHLIKEGRIKGK